MNLIQRMVENKTKSFIIFLMRFSVTHTSIADKRGAYIAYTHCRWYAHSALRPRPTKKKKKKNCAQKYLCSALETWQNIRA